MNCFKKKWMEKLQAAGLQWRLYGTYNRYRTLLGQKFEFSSLFFGRIEDTKKADL